MAGPLHFSMGMAVSDSHPWLRRVARTTAVVLAVLALFLLVWQARNVLLLIFAGMLLAVIFRGLGDFLARHSRLSRHWALGVSLVLVALLLAGVGTWAGPYFETQIDRLVEVFPEAMSNLSEGLRETDWGPVVVEQIRRFEGTLTRGPRLFEQFTGVASVALGVLTNLVVMLFLGLYFAAQPGLYKQGLLRLFPKRQRSHLDDVFREVWKVLGWWLWGKILAMLLVGAATWIGLWALGIPLPFLLALVAALLTFIPNFGPVFSALPAMILGFAQGLWMGLWVVLLYLGIQVVESYVITPLIQRKAVDLPPALILTSQVLLGILMGFLGLVLATPLAAAALVLVRRLWVEDTLDDDVRASYGPHDRPAPAG